MPVAESSRSASCLVDFKENKSVLPAAFPAWFFCSLLLVVAVAYGRSLLNGFVYDDELVITGNMFIRSFQHWKDFFTPAYFSGSGELSYRPWVTLSYFVDSALFREASWGYHLHNLLLHLGVTLSVVWLMSSLSLRGWPVWLAALLFAVHPAAVESVACPANREELYCAFFLNCSLGLLFRGRFLPWACLLYFLALLSKETAMVGPVLFLGYHIFMWLSSHGEGDSKSARAVGGVRHIAAAGSSLVMTLCFYSIVRFVLMRSSLGDTLGYHGGGLLDNVLTHAGGWARMLFLFVNPTVLSVDYSHADIVSWSLAGLVIPVVLLGAAWWLASRKMPVLGFGLFWIVCAYAPAAGFVPIANVFAERFLYLPLVGLALSAAALGEVFQRQLGRWTVVVVLLWVVCLCVVSQQRVEVWKNNESLWSDALARNPLQARSRNNFGYVLFKKGLVDAAMREYEEAAVRDPSLVEARTNLACCLEENNQLVKAAANYESALMITQADPKIFLSYGDVLGKMNRFKEAREQYQRALALRPDFAEAYNNLGVLNLREGRSQEAQLNFRRAIGLLKEYPDALCNLGSALGNDGKIQEAVSCWKLALKINPHHQASQENLKKVQNN